jgi:hypothetical protein
MLFSCEKTSSVVARQVTRLPGSCLAITFRESVPLVLWQLELSKSSTAIVALRGKDDDWNLGLVESKGDFTVVAHFDNQDDAEAAFAAVQKAFMKGRPLGSSTLWRWIAAILVIFGVIMIGGALTGSSSGSKASLKTTAEQSRVSTEPEKGVPLVADDILKNPESPFGMLSK